MIACLDPSRLFPSLGVPLIEAGLRAVRIFAAEGIKTNVTLCFSAAQAILAAKAGATFVSPFVGRLDDIGLYIAKSVTDPRTPLNFVARLRPRF